MKVSGQRLAKLRLKPLARLRLKPLMHFCRVTRSSTRSTRVVVSFSGVMGTLFMIVKLVTWW